MARNCETGCNAPKKGGGGRKEKREKPGKRKKKKEENAKIRQNLLHKVKE